MDGGACRKFGGANGVGVGVVVEGVMATAVCVGMTIVWSGFDAAVVPPTAMGVVVNARCTHQLSILILKMQAVSRKRGAII